MQSPRTGCTRCFLAEFWLSPRMAPLANLFQSSVNHKDFFPFRFEWNSLHFIFAHCLLCLFPVNTDKSLTRPFLLPFLTPQYVADSLVWGSPALDKSLEMCLTSAECRGRATSLSLLPKLLLMQLRLLSVSFAARTQYWVIFNLVSIRTPRPFSAKLLFSQSAPNTADAWGYPSPDAGLCFYLCRTSWGSCLFSQPVEILLSRNTTLWSIICKVAEGVLCHIPQVISEVLNSSVPSIGP